MALAREVMLGGFSAGQANALGGQYNSSLAALGSSQGTAALVTTSNVIVTGADGTKGIVLPAGQPGDEILVFNNAASTCPVYPPAGAAITVVGTGLGSANAAFSLLTYKSAQFNCLSATQWLVNVSA
jgi:hypothetical protein